MFFGLVQLLNKILFFSGYISNKSSFLQPLSSEEEEVCLKRYKADGDLQARETLIKHNMRLVAHVVKKYNKAADTDDLISVGSIGLIKGISTFEYGKGTQLATYVARCIENEILMLIRANKKYKNNISLTEAVGVDTEGNEFTLMDLLCVKEEGVFKQVEVNMLTEKILKTIRDTLTEREYMIICNRYGFGGCKSYTQREIAKRLNISRSYISRIEKKALSKIKEELVKQEFFND
jgi:RNA polymerase sporulation-specific sigma factor